MVDGRFPDWHEAVRQTAEDCRHRDGLAAYIGEVAIATRVALYDRNEHGAKWRRIFLVRQSEERWTLHKEDGVVIDEPDAGCPAEGFSTESVLSDVGMEYYSIAAVDEKDAPEPAQDDAAVDDYDLKRGRLKDGGQVGTLRTREGSNDSVLPAHKVAFIHDEGAGRHVLLKHDEVLEHVEILSSEDDTTPATLRASRLLRSSGTTIEGSRTCRPATRSSSSSRA